MADEPLKWANIPLNGKWRPAIDGTELAEGDFQTLKNMRYGEITPKSVSGMTDLNTNVINATYLKPRAGFHFRKSQPSESHNIVQSWNTGLSTALVYDKSSAITTVGDFTATEIWTDTAGADVARMSNAPDGYMIYANGKDTCIWGGAEYRCGGFIVGDLGDVVKKDYTRVINNTLTDAANIATLVKVSGTVDSNTMLLLHLDNNVTDSSYATIHTVTNVGSAVTFSTTCKFLTHAAVFNGTTGYLTIPDDPDFDFSTETFTIDFWMNILSGEHDGETIYYQETDDNNYFRIKIGKSGSGYRMELTINDTSVITLTFTSTTYDMVAGTWYHIALVGDGTYFYWFINGILSGTVAKVAIAGYTDVVHVGCSDIAGHGNFFTGSLDEFRVSNSARWTTNFVPSTVAYGTDAAYVYIASTRPIKGVKFYPTTANTAVSSAGAKYWASGVWNEVTSLVDGTRDVATSTKTLARDGTISFASTVTTAKPKLLNNVYAYWYLFTFSGIDDTTTIEYVTLDAPMQQIVDLWDGIRRTIGSFIWENSGITYERTTNILKEDYIQSNDLTYISMALLTTDCLKIGFTERMTGIGFVFAPGKENTSVSDIKVYYWNGSDWTQITTSIYDGTRVGTDSFGVSGVVTWDAPSEISEFKTSLLGGNQFYYYKIMFSANLSSPVYLDFVYGIPAQKTILSHAYPVMWQNRVVLLNEVSKDKNSALIGAGGGSSNIACVFNGEDSTRIYFGDENPVVGGASLFSRYGGSTYDNLVVFKRNEVWIIEGTTPEDFRPIQISGYYGLASPGTLKSCSTGYEVSPGLMKHILIWQSENSICLFDGNSIMDISKDISNYFDKQKTECITSTMIHKSEAFFDESLSEYHWLFASASGQTTLNKEFVYNLVYKKWFEIDRGTGKYIQIGYPVMDTNGVKYCFGGLDTGYIEHLELGNTFDGTSITSTFKTGDISFGGWVAQTKVRRVKHICVAKTTTTNTVSMTHYNDTESSATDTVTYTVNVTGKRVAKVNKSVNWDEDSIYHSFQCSLITLNEPTGYEPIGMAIGYRVTREDIL